MINLATLIILNLAKLLRLSIKSLGQSGATAAPGYYALKLDQKFISNLLTQLKSGSIIVSGTNGKTTTARLIATILKGQNLKFIHNRAGSNLSRGIASILVQQATIFGQIEADWGLWEVDEAILPDAITQIKPKIIILLNLFRDQLDRYGEVDKVKKIWQRAISKLPKSSTLILNADDPAIAHIGHNFAGNVLYFGISDKKMSIDVVPRFADTKYCPNCATSLVYEEVYLSHLGKYKCPSCGRKRPDLDFFAASISCLSPVETEFVLKSSSFSKNFKISLGGIYNIYNVLASQALASSTGINLNKATNSLKQFKSAFGRVEEIATPHAKLTIFLIKNPSGANEVLKTILTESKKINLFVALNDKFADGQDVSWIWDVDFETYKTKVKKLVVSGTRAYDLALRLKYAQIQKPNLITENFGQAVKSVIDIGEDFYILPTYTALLEIRRGLNRYGFGNQFWKE